MSYASTIKKDTPASSASLHPQTVPTSAPKSSWGPGSTAGGAVKDNSFLSKVKEAPTKAFVAPRYVPPIPSSPSRIHYKIDFLLSFKSKCTTLPLALPKRMPTIGFEYEQENEAEADEDVKLHTSVNRWTITEATGDDAVLRGVQAFLNKLTIEKFDKLVVEFDKLEISSSELVKKIVEMVIAKAQTDQHFSRMYAALCVVLSEKKYSFDSENATFKKELVAKCGEHFFNGLEDYEKEKKEKKEKDTSKGVEDVKDEGLEGEKETLSVRKRNIGNMVFLGELFNCKLLKPKQIHEMIQLLFGDVSSPDIVHDDLHLELLSKLISTVGKELDEGKNSKLVTKYVEAIEEISHQEGLPSRIKFMLLEVVELRARDWVPRVEEPTAMSLSDLHGKKKKAAVVVDEEGWITKSEASGPRKKKSKGVEEVVKDKKGKDGGKKKKDYSPDEVRKVSKSVMKEYLSNHSNEELIITLSGIPHHLLDEVAITFFNDAMELKDGDRDSFSKMITLLMTSGILTIPSFIKGLLSVIEQIDDIAIDVPHAPINLAYIMKPLLGSVSFAEKVKKATWSLIPEGKNGDPIKQLFDFLE